MKNGTQRVLDDLRALVHELEKSFSMDSALEDNAEAGEQLPEGLARARQKAEELESGLRSQLRRGANVTDRYVQSNPWLAIGTVAVVAFVLGALVSRRGPD